VFFKMFDRSATGDIKIKKMQLVSPRFPFAPKHILPRAQPPSGRSIANLRTNQGNARGDGRS
jgi:hypothetical protein